MGETFYIINSELSRKEKRVFFYSENNICTDDISEARIFSNEEIIKFHEKKKGLISYAGNNDEFNIYLPTCKFMVLNKEYIYKTLTGNKRMSL